MPKSRKIRVLVVDNEMEFASTLAERLRLRKMEAECIYSGEDALISVARSAPDVMLVDLEMPDMSGLDILSKIKVMNPNIAVILLTGHGSVDSGIIGMERGAYDYLTKPIDLTVLMEKITEAYNMRKVKKA